MKKRCDNDCAKKQRSSQFPDQQLYSLNEKRQEKEDDGVAEGVAYAVVEEFHTGFGPEEFRGDVERPVGEAEDETREREGTRDDVHVRFYDGIPIADSRQQHQDADNVGYRRDFLQYPEKDGHKSS